MCARISFDHLGAVEPALDARARDENSFAQGTKKRRRSARILAQVTAYGCCRKAKLTSSSSKRKAWVDGWALPMPLFRLTTRCRRQRSSPNAREDHSLARDRDGHTKGLPPQSRDLTRLVPKRNSPVISACFVSVACKDNLLNCRRRRDVERAKPKDALLRYRSSPDMTIPVAQGPVARSIRGTA